MPSFLPKLQIFCTKMGPRHSILNRFGCFWSQIEEQSLLLQNPSMHRGIITSELVRALERPRIVRFSPTVNTFGPTTPLLVELESCNWLHWKEHSISHKMVPVWCIYYILVLSHGGSNDMHTQNFAVFGTFPIQILTFG